MTNPFGIPERSIGCLSDYALDALAGAPRTADTGAARAHVESCDDCGARFESVLRQKEQFAARDPLAFPEPAAVRRRTPALRWIAGGAAGLLAVAASVLLLARGPQGAPDSEDQRGLKGNVASFGFEIVRPDGTIVGDELTAIAHPGDRLKWRFDVREPSYAAVLSRDGAGAATVYFPDGSDAQRLSPGADSPTAVELDAVLGGETLHALFCVRPVALAPLRTELERTGRVTAPEGCTLRTRTLEKRLP